MQLTDSQKKVLFAIYRLMPFFAILIRDSGLSEEEACEAMLALQLDGLASLEVDGETLDAEHQRYRYKLTDAGKYAAALMGQKDGE